MSDDSASDAAPDSPAPERPARPTFIAAEEATAAPPEEPTAAPPEEATAAPYEKLVAAWRRRSRRLSWPLLAGAAAAVAILAVVTVAVIPGEPDGPGPREKLNVGSLAVPKATRDPVPRGAIVTKYPPACGVPKATAHEVVPGSDADGRAGGLFTNASNGSCLWYALNDGDERRGIVLDGDRLRKERVLNVDMALTTATAVASPIGEAMRQVDYGVGATRASSASRIVTGLGDEARAGYSPAIDAGAFVRFRVGNMAVSVIYHGWDRKGKDPARRAMPERAAMTGALKAASGIAKSLGVATPSTPSFAPPRATTPPIRRPPKPCDTVKGETLRKVANGAHREGSDAAPFGPPQGTNPVLAPAPMATDTCRWTARTPITSDQLDGSVRELEVTIAAVADRGPGTAIQLATREYLRHHHNARDSRRDGTSNPQQGFMAIGGLGDQAFAVYGRHPNGYLETPGRVVFRLRNVLVQVSYASAYHDPDPLTRNEAINGAYTVALDVATALSHS